MPVPACQSDASSVTRRRWRIAGQVQGVGFRPFVYRSALDHDLTGWVCNDAQGVTIEAQGDLDALSRFGRTLEAQLPPLAAVTSIEHQHASVIAGESAFTITQSDADRSQPDRQAGVTVDAAVCEPCLHELFAPGDRRHRHPLINCTNCGPRYSIIRQVPYDRPNTSMAQFAMCDHCTAEYHTPSDRRFHAQPTACNDCGPTISLISLAGKVLADDAIKAAGELLTGGGIVAVKGLGGFHLAARADDPVAVERLRVGKRRNAKPFAVMARSPEVARTLVSLSDDAARLMASPVCPIVLAPRNGVCRLADNVAPGMHRLAVMLPYTPIHHLLFDAMPIDVLVMTSGNVSDEPLAIDNDEAIARLGEMCDALLLHDRSIVRAVDDSVVIDLPDGPMPVRRARGYVPTRLPLPDAVAERVPNGLCLGGELKNTAAVVREGAVIVSQHLGNLRHPASFEAFKAAVNDLQQLFDIQPRWIAHDLHPDYVSTGWARELSRRTGLPLVAVQHHHAHAASLLAEHGRSVRTLVVACDGVGYGSDGGTWGGELLLADLASAVRLARLRPLRLPGGDAAAKDTRRCALALLFNALGEGFADHPVVSQLYPENTQRDLLCQMIRRNVHCASSSAAGRYFDGAAALLGVCSDNAFEGRAPMLLEAVAASVPAQEVAALVEGGFGVFKGRLDELDLSPLVRTMLDEQVRGASVSRLAAAFHTTMARAWARIATLYAHRTGIDTVGLTGGVFCNERLLDELSRLLMHEGLGVLRHHRVPPGDGGISYGQAAVAAARFARGPKPHRRSLSQGMEVQSCV